MASLHAKSPCCGEKVVRFGNRRRQCAACRKTWRIRKKRRGRKRIRTNPLLAVRYVRRMLPPADARNKDRRQRRLARSGNHLERMLPWPPLPSRRPLIAVADAVRIRTEKRILTLYLMLVRSASASRAWIAEPYVQEGKESWQGWQEAFAILPVRTMKGIVALVSDGHKGLESVARRHGWLFQRCHFHLIAKLQGRRSRWASSRHRLAGEYLYAMVHEILTHPDDATAYRLRDELEEHMTALGGGQVQRYLRAFLRETPEYRTYLWYPLLHIPRTSNTAEALVAIIRRLLSRAHGFRTRASIIRWVTALLKTRQTMMCNGSAPTELLR